MPPSRLPAAYNSRASCAFRGFKLSSKAQSGQIHLLSKSESLASQSLHQTQPQRAQLLHLFLSHCLFTGNPGLNPVDILRQMVWVATKPRNSKLALRVAFLHRGARLRNTMRLVSQRFEQRRHQESNQLRYQLETGRGQSKRFLQRTVVLEPTGCWQVHAESSAMQT